MSSPLNPSYKTNPHQNHEVYRLSESTLSNSNKSLDQGKIDQIEKKFHSITEKLEYNTLAPVLELIVWMREHQEDNFRKAILDFSVSPMAVLEKHHGGSPALVAAAFSEKMEQMGYETTLVGEARPVAKQFYFPTPGNKTLDLPLGWEEAKEHLDGMTHHFLTFQYSDEREQPHTLVFRKYFSNETPTERYDDLDSLKEDVARRSSKPLLHITDRLEAVKSSMRINFKYFVIQNDSREVLRIDILNGTLSVIPGKVEGMVQNTDGKVEFNFADLLEHPEEKIQVIINGQNRNIQKKELAGLLLLQVKDHFHFTPDFSENLSIFIKNRASFIKEAMVNPAETIYNTWELYKKTDYSHQQAHYAYNRTSQERRNEHKKLYQLGENAFLKGIKAMQKGDASEVKLHFSTASKMFEQCILTCGEIQREPKEIVLDGFQYF